MNQHQMTRIQLFHENLKFFIIDFRLLPTNYRDGYYGNLSNDGKYR